MPTSSPTSSDNDWPKAHLEPETAEFQVVALAIEQLAQMLSLPPDRIEVILVKAVVWRDGDLGCGGSGKMAAQQITPGYVVILQALEQNYRFHSDESGSQVVLCSRNPSPIPAETESPHPNRRE